MRRHGRVLYALRDSSFEHVSDGFSPLHVHFSSFGTMCSKGTFVRHYIECTYLRSNVYASLFWSIIQQPYTHTHTHSLSLSCVSKTRCHYHRQSRSFLLLDIYLGSTRVWQRNPHINTAATVSTVGTGTRVGEQADCSQFCLCNTSLLRSATLAASKQDRSTW